MRRLLSIAVLPLLIAPAAQDPLPSMDRLTGPLPGEGRLRMTIACGALPPASIAAWFHEADAIVHVRIDSQFAYDHYWDPTEEPNILSDVEGTVLEVFKLHPRGVGAGATMTFTHPGGTLMRAGGPETHLTNSFLPPTNGTEWFLFLDWYEETQQFWISYLEDGAFPVVNGLIANEGGSGVAPAWHGKDAEAFADALWKGAAQRRAS